MFRLFGALMVCAVCIMYGFSAADRLRKSRDFLNAFISSLTVLETEISFGKNTLDRIFERFKDERRLCGIYKSCKEDMPRLGIKRAWEAAADKTSREAGLSREAGAAVKSLGTELGMSDVSGQKKAIARVRELTAACAAAAEDEYARMGRTYRMCGVLTGIACVIAFV